MFAPPKAVVPLIVLADGMKLDSSGNWFRRYYFWFFGIAIELPLEREIPFDLEWLIKEHGLPQEPVNPNDVEPWLREQGLLN